MSTRSWDPARFLSSTGPDSSTPIYVVILNQPISNPDLLISLCRKAILTICADGGANRLKDLSLSGEDETICLPNAIVGDLDSLLPATSDYYKSKGTRIINDGDQYSTDVTKCFAYISNQICGSGDTPPNLPSTIDIVLIAGLGGRADQAFSLYQSLYTSSFSQTKFQAEIYLLAPESIVFLLHKGLNKITTSIGPNLLGENVGIIPIGRPSVITTLGLEYNVTDWPTEFGVQVSTSNHIRSEIVEVETTERVLFTVEIGKEQ